jgi:uncharacterized protein (TIGR03437 family)
VLAALAHPEDTAGSRGILVRGIRGVDPTRKSVVVTDEALPGMLMSLYGTKLANSTQSAKSLPLPLTFDGVSVTVNGLPAPLWFISPGQINLQIPYETALGSALVVVNNNGQVSSYTIQVTPTAPGIFGAL